MHNNRKFLEERFKSYVILTEGGISALIEMNFAEDAKKAFKALAYSRLRTMPLYLEWAPGDVFGTPKDEVIKPQPKSGECSLKILVKSI